MKTSSCKAKGRRLQYYIAEKIAELFNIKFDSSDDLCPIKSRLMGNSGTDIYITDKKLNDLFPYDIEIKNVEKPSIKSWISQAKSNTKENRNFLLFWKCKEFKKPVVILDSDEFFNLIKRSLK